MSVKNKRDVLLEGALNFRDLGGYITEDGRKVKWGHFFRSAELSKLTQKDLETLSKAGIKTIIDYRSIGETENQPNQEIPKSVTFHLPAMEMDPNMAKNLDFGKLTKESLSIESLKGAADLETTYPKLAFGNPSYKKLFELMEDKSNTPILQHCTAGKDRTGVGSALLLLLLGVPEEIVMEDYLLTNDRLQPMIAHLESRLEEISVDEAVKAFFIEMMSAPEKFLASVFTAIRNRYPSYDEFFLKEYGIDEDKRNKLKNLYLE